MLVLSMQWCICFFINTKQNNKVKLSRDHSYIPTQKDPCCSELQICWVWKLGKRYWPVNRACSSMGIPSHGEILKEFFGGDGAEEAIMMVRANYFNCLVEPGSLTPWAVWVSQMGWGWGLSDLFSSSLSFISDIYYGFSVLQNLLNLSLNYPSHWN